MRLLAVLIVSLSLTACGSTPPPGPKLPSPLEMFQQVRDSGVESAQFDVVPLRDAAVADLIDQADLREKAQRFEEASKAIASALALMPQDPELIQRDAELRLLRKDWSGAESAALRSYAIGPKVGGLCRRNWSTVRFARLSLGNAAGAAEAERGIAACTLAPPPRF